MSTQQKSFKAAIAEIKMAYTISDYIRSAGVRLTANGVDKWKGLCPFHSEKTPSFSCSDHFQNYHCWGCGASGDIINYVMRTESLEFGQAVRKLAEDKGIEIASEGAGDGIDYRSLRECLRVTANFFYREYKKLPEEHPARRQVLDRGLTEDEMIYGYAPEKRTALYDHLKENNFTEEVMLQAGVVSFWEKSNRYSDFWSGRLMFIITDPAGKAIGFAGRKLFEDDTRGKFVNSQAGPLFDKSSALFNIQNAKKAATTTQEIYVAEGQFDVAALIHAGATNVVASSGTAFTPKQGQLLQRLVGEAGKVIFAFDGDEAGVKAALKVFHNVPSLHSTAYVVPFPEKTDPCDYRLEHGNDGLLDLLTTKRVSLVEFVLAAFEAKLDMTSEMERSKYLEYAARILKTIPSKATRESLIAKVSLRAFADADEVRRVISEASPIDLQTIAASEEESAPTETRSYEEEELARAEELITRIGQSSLYDLSARFLSLALQFPELIEYLPKNRDKLPAEFGTLIDDTQKLGTVTKIVPELFTDSVLASHLITTNYFPLAHLEQFDAREQFAHLYKRIVRTATAAEDMEVKRRISRLLAASTDQSPAFLAEALRLQEEELRRLRSAPVEESIYA